MKFSDGIYAVSNFEKKRLWILYMTTPCPLANKSTDHLQTICYSMLGFFSISQRALRGRSWRFHECQHCNHLLPLATAELDL